ncbi:probable serine/threonine-protein kinase kinX [Musca domestica]|uniref:Probable serine/threonine-protein kinase kinX n=1 Tax=Musca domestica TaxID=7370 RepID=A0ABM3VB33_MUSDO|nr:probable serine/threonine-protein kinase kinX [Musca domestica]
MEDVLEDHGEAIEDSSTMENGNQTYIVSTHYEEDEETQSTILNDDVDEYREIGDDDETTITDTRENEYDRIRVGLPKKDEENVEYVEMEDVLEDHGEATKDSSTMEDGNQTYIVSTHYEEDEEEETQSTILDDDVDEYREIGDDGETTITDTTENEYDRIREGLPERAMDEEEETQSTILNDDVDEYREIGDDGETTITDTRENEYDRIREGLPKKDEDNVEDVEMEDVLEDHAKKFLKIVDVNNFYEDTEGDIDICLLEEKKDEENVEMEDVLEDHGEAIEDSSTMENGNQTYIVSTHYEEDEETQSTILNDDVDEYREIGDDGETTITDTRENEYDRIREGLPKKDEENVEDVEMDDVLEDHGEATKDSSTMEDGNQTYIVSTHYEEDEEEETQSTILDDDVDEYREIGDDGETTITDTTENEYDRIREGLPERAMKLYMLIPVNSSNSTPVHSNMASQDSDGTVKYWQGSSPW